MNENLLEAEWEEAFPFEQEYQRWINGIEADYRQECQERMGIATTSNSKFVLHKNNEEFSPYLTVNS